MTTTVAPVESVPSVLESRPRVKQDVLFTETPGGVLFHNAQSGFQLTAKSAYRLCTLLTPYLNGEHVLGDICASLPAAQQRMVVELVEALYERGFARDASPDSAGAEAVAPEVAARFAEQINYVDHHVAGGHERFQRFRAARIAVLGTDLVARSCVLSLVRNGAATVGAALDSPDVTAEATELVRQGCPVELLSVNGSGTLTDWADLAGYDVVVVCGDDRQVQALLAAGVPVGVSLLSASTFANRAVVGPLMTSRRDGCWVCAALRYGANGDPGVVADAFSGLITAPRAAAAGPRRWMAAMIGNLLGYEVFRLLTGALPAETEGQAIVQNLDSMDSATEPLLPHPDCPHCSSDAVGEDLYDVGPATTERTTPATADEAGDLLDELNRGAVLIRSNLGVFTSFDDEPFTQMPVKVGRIRFGLGHTRRRTITAFDVHHTVGARIRALHRSAEVYAEHAARLREDVTLSRVAPSRLVIASSLGAGEADVAHWVGATSLLSGERYAVPAAAVQSFGPYNRDGLVVPTSGGTGSGRTNGEALAAALRSALAYDAIRQAMSAGAAVTTAALSAMDGDAELKFLVSSARNLNLDVDLLDLGPSATAVQLLARTTNPATGASVWAVGSQLSWQEAAVDALRDLIGLVQVGAELPSGETPDIGDPLLRTLDPYTFGTLPGRDPDLSGGTTWPAVLDSLREAGRDVLAVSTTPADLASGGLATARVLLVERAG